MSGRMLTAVGPALRQGGIALRWRWVAQVEADRDAAMAGRDRAIADKDRAVELREIADRARRQAHETTCALDHQVGETERVLVSRGFPHPGGGEHLALAVDNALDSFAERLTEWRDRGQALRHAMADALGMDPDRHLDEHLLARLRVVLDDGRRAQQLNDELRERGVPPRAQRLVEGALWVHAVAGHDRDQVMFSGRVCGYSAKPTFVIERSDGTRQSWVADLVVEADEQQPPTDTEETRDETVRRLAREIIAARDVLAPDVDTTGTPLTEVARAALASAGATAAAAELRWWASQRYLERETLRARAEHLDPSGMTSDADEPPTPTIFRASDEPCVPRPAAAGLAANLARAARTAAQQRDAKAGHPVEVLAALRAADRAREVHERPTYRVVLPGELSYTEALVVLARAVRAYGEEPDPVPDAEVEQLAREAAHQAVVDGGVERERAPEVVDALARAGFVPGVYPPGMAIDGDMLRSLITDALPRWATDEFAGELADSVLDAAVRAGFTLLHGTKLVPRPPAEPEQHYAEKAIERAREYLISLGYESIVDDHGEDVASMLRETLGVLRDRAARVGSPANGGIFEISRARTEQQADHGYTLQHDDQHTAGELARAAHAYLVGTPTDWPRGWGMPPHFPDCPVERLAKAGALIAAEIDRLRRAENRAATADDDVADAEIQDAESTYVNLPGLGMGPLVCSVCLTISPCSEHQPKLLAKLRASSGCDCALCQSGEEVPF